MYMMKNYLTQKTSQLCFLVIIALACSCGGDDGPTPLEERLRDLTATWSVSSVSNDNTDVTSQFSGFNLTVSGDKTYSTTNGGNPWPASGTFDIASENLDLFRRDDNVDISIVNITETQLTLSFNMSSVRGTASGITGSFTFNLTKTN
ncbi:MAG: hypothetical protein Roseis2KO_39270 [Roseivirga sp.]